MNRDELHDRVTAIIVRVGEEAGGMRSQREAADGILELVENELQLRDISPPWFQVPLYVDVDSYKTCDPQVLLGQFRHRLAAKLQRAGRPGAAATLLGERQEDWSPGSKLFNGALKHLTDGKLGPDQRTAFRTMTGVIEGPCDECGQLGIMYGGGRYRCYYHKIEGDQE
jgi:hypothetical protein